MSTVYSFFSSYAQKPLSYNTGGAFDYFTTTFFGFFVSFLRLSFPFAIYEY